ncbi:MAG: SDR family oxidoreductase [candidate division KSB1 bacterium]|nr:SDR family oxidoreductase [candidate division KSB1 bacterium]
MSVLDAFSLKDKVAVITGASKGIGEAIARAYAEAGARVVISSRKQDAVDAAAADLRARGLDAVGIAAHVGQMEDLDRLVQQTLDTYGGIDILVNNAAINPVFGPILDTDEAVFDKIMQVNLKGPFELGKRVHPIMKERGGGSVINISSIGGISPEPGLGIYSVSKAALISLTKVMAKEWGDDRIRVNAICPGLIKTKFSTALWQNEKIKNRVLAQQPIKRIGLPEDVVGLALFLASEASAYCTGAVYMVDGGHVI